MKIYKRAPADQFTLKFYLDFACGRIEELKVDEISTEIPDLDLRARRARQSSRGDGR